MKRSFFLLASIIFSHFLFSQHNPSNSDTIRGQYLGQKPPGMTPELFAPEVVSSGENFENGCTFSTDGKEFYFGRTLGKEGVTYVIKNINGVWRSPEIINISDAQFLTEPHINHKGDQLFFTEFSPSSDPNIRVRGNISTSDKIEGEWSQSKILWVGMFATTSENGHIYYTNNEEQGIYKRTFNKGYSEGEKVVIENCTFPTSHPYIAPDESYLIYGGFNPQGQSKGQWADLYISFKYSDNTFSEPINLGDKINNQYPNICPMVSPDGKYLFYSNKGDIYWVDAKFITELKPKELK